MGQATGCEPPTIAATSAYTPIQTWYMFAISPDSAWLAAVVDVPDGIGKRQVAISTRGAPLRVLCGFCGGGAGPGRVLAPAISWTRDGRAMLVSAQCSAPATVTSNQDYTILIPLHPDAALPSLPDAGIGSVQDWLDLPGARRIAKQNILPGANPEQLFFYDLTTIRNLHRVQLPH